MPEKEQGMNKGRNTPEASIISDLIFSEEFFTPGSAYSICLRRKHGNS